MKILTLKDGTQVPVCDLSTFKQIVNVFHTIEEIEDFESLLEGDALSDAYLGDEHFSDEYDHYEATEPDENDNMMVRYLMKPELVAEDEFEDIIGAEGADEESEDEIEETDLEESAETENE